jgi:hypothetical protein
MIFLLTFFLLEINQKNILQAIKGKNVRDVFGYVDSNSFTPGRYILGLGGIAFAIFSLYRYLLRDQNPY